MKMMKRAGALVLILMAAQALFFSCGEAGVEADDEKEGAGKALLYGSVKIPEPSEDSKASSSNSFKEFVELYVKSQSSSPAKTIKPSFPSENPVYSVYATSDGGKTKIDADVDSSGNYSILIPADGFYIFYAEVSVKVSDSSEKVVYKGNTPKIEVKDGKVTGADGSQSDEIPAIEAKPTKEESGNVALLIDVSGASGIQYVKAEWTKSEDSSTGTYSTVLSSSERTVTLYLSGSDNSDTAVASGTYTLTLYFYSDTEGKNEIYRIPGEIVQVYDNLTSNVYSGNATYMSGNTIKITSSMISGTAYAAGTGATLKKNGSENGTYYAPFSSIEKAIEKVNASGSSEMTVYIDGTFTLSSPLSLSMDTGKTLNIFGLNGTDSSVITNTAGYGIDVASGNVNLISLSVKGCQSSGINNGGNLALNGCVISENGTGGAVAGGINNAGTLSLSDTEIKENVGSSAGGIVATSSFSIGGTVTVSDNYSDSAKTTKSNVLLPNGATLNLTETLSDTSRIGISLETALGAGESKTLTSGYKTYGPAAGTIFTSDADDDCEISVDASGEVAIGKNAVVWISSNGNDSNTGTYDSPFASFKTAFEKLSSITSSSASSEKIVKIKDTLTPTAGLDADVEITAVIQGAAGDSRKEKAAIDLHKIVWVNNEGANDNASGFRTSSKQNLTFKNLTFTTGGESSYVYGAIAVDNNAEVTIEDCDFTNINAKGACSAIAFESGSLTLKNVNITGNTASLDTDGTRTYAVGFMTGAGTLTLDGKVIISGNTQSDGKSAGNLFIDSGKSLQFAENFSPESKISFSAGTKPSSLSPEVAFASGYNLDESPDTVFTDDDGYIISKNDDGSLVISASGGGSVNISKPDLVFSLTSSGKTYTVAANSGGKDVTASVTGWKVYVAESGVDITDAAGVNVTAAAGSNPAVTIPEGMQADSYTIEITGTYDGNTYHNSVQITVSQTQNL